MDLKHKLDKPMIKEIFRLQNTWRFGETFPFSLRKRTILELILNNLNNKKILGLIGSRQVGKSSLLYLTISHLIETNINVNDIYYFNLDDLKLHELFKNVPDFINFIQATAGTTKHANTSHF